MSASTAAIRRLRAAAAVVLLSLLAGCATPGDTPPAAAQRRDALAALPSWSLAGRAAVNDAGHGWQASVRWRSQADVYRVDLSGPFGQGQVRLVGSPEQVVLTVDGVTRRAADAERLLLDATGLRLPLAGLRYWLRALAAPGEPGRFTYDARGRPFRLQQAGWVIEYPNYVRVDGLELPQRIRATRGELTVKLAVQTWRLD